MNQPEVTTLEDIKQELVKEIQTEISRMTLGSWSVEASGSNFLDIFNEFPIQDIIHIVDELKEGSSFKISLDLTEDLISHLEYLCKRYGGDVLDEDKTSNEQDL